MDVERNVWIVAHNFTTPDGKTIRREVGQSCGQLFQSFKSAYKARKKEFHNWHLRMQPQASMDDIICHWHTMLIAEESAEAGAACHQVDMFQSEISTQTQRSKFVSNVATTTVPPRQTAKMQGTDLLQARLGKLDIAVTNQAQRRRKRQKALESGSAPLLECTAMGIMEIADSVQVAIEKDADENNGVMKAFRMGGFGAFTLDSTDAVIKAQGGHWDEAPLHNNRIDAETWGLRPQIWLIN